MMYPLTRAEDTHVTAPRAIPAPPLRLADSMDSTDSARSGHCSTARMTSAPTPWPVIATSYWRFAHLQARGSSPTYERLALAVHDDERAVALLATLPPGKTQPNLLFGVMRWHDVPVEDPAAALAWLHENHDTVRAELLQRATQTNEAARCAVLLPALAQLAARTDGPLALLEIGASAGLCLLYDAWRYRYTRPDGTVHVLGAPNSPVELRCTVEGPVPLPSAVPDTAWRAGLDLDPLDPHDEGVRRWLRCLVWPEHTDRADRLRAGLAVAAQHPAVVRRGDMTRDLEPLLDEARRQLDVVAGRGRGAVVVTHSAALVYVDHDDRRGIVETTAEHGAHRLGVEGESVLRGVQQPLPAGVEAGGRFVVSLDGAPLALADPHGSELVWLSSGVHLEAHRPAEHRR